MTDPESPLPSLDDRLRDQRRILEHLAEHTDTSEQTMKSNFQIAAALGLEPEGVRSALMALVEKGHVKVPKSNYGGVAAHITAAGQDFIQHGPAPTSQMFITQVLGNVHALQQGSNNTLQQITPRTAQGAALSLLLAFQDFPPDVRKQAGDQLQDLQEELASPTAKASRILASLTALLSISGNDPEVWRHVAEVARQCGISFPEGQHGPG